MTLTSTVAVNVTGNYSIAADLATKTCNLLKTYNVSLASGTASGQADLIYHDRRTLAGSATEDLDLAASLIDPLTGAVMTFARVKLVLVIAASGNTNDVQVTRPAANGVPIFLAAGDGAAVKPNGALFLHAPGAGYVVTAATGDLITVTNSAGGTDVTYDVVLIGASA
jgi:hypothetical protein